MEDKKSILLYLDTIEQWEKLTDEQAGILIKALLRYGNTGEMLETSDGALEMSFSFITAQIDRDSVKWADKREKRRKSAVLRWAKENNAKNANAQNAMQNNAKNANAYNADKCNANNAVTVTVTGTVTDTVTVNKKEIYKEKGTALDSIIIEYTDNEKLQNALKEYIKLRKALKSPLTDRALQLATGKLDKLADTDEKKIAIIEQSIERGWKGLFPLKDEPKEQKADDMSKYDFVINNF